MTGAEKLIIENKKMIAYGMKRLKECAEKSKAE